MRQSNGNPSADMSEKASLLLFHNSFFFLTNYCAFSQIWILLALCIVAFLPSKHLFKYLDSYIRQNSQHPSKYLPFVEWCGEQLRSPRIAERKMVYKSFFLFKQSIKILLIFILMTSLRRCSKWKPFGVLVT